MQKEWMKKQLFIHRCVHIHRRNSVPRFGRGGFLAALRTPEEDVAKLLLFSLKLFILGFQSLRRTIALGGPLGSKRKPGTD